MKSITSQVLEKIKSQPRGRVFSASDFLRLGGRNAVDQALGRLMRRREIRRVARGIYERPKIHPKLGALAPNAEEVAAAVARRSGIKLQASGAAVANQLGISTQVAMRPVYLTPGSAESIRLGKQTIEFRHVRPKWFVLPGTHAGNVFQAVLHLGKGGATAEIIHRLRALLTETEKSRLERQLASAPTWAHEALRAICEPNVTRMSEAA